MSDALAKVTLPTFHYSYFILIFAGLARGSLQSLRQKPLLERPISPGSPLWHRRIASHHRHPSRPTLASQENRREMWRARMYSSRKVGILYLSSIISSAFLSPLHIHHVCLCFIPHNIFMLGTWAVSWYFIYPVPKTDQNSKLVSRCLFICAHPTSN